MHEWMGGRQPVYEVLRAGRRHCYRLILAEGVQEKSRIADIIKLGDEKNIPIERQPRTRLDSRIESNQGVVLEADDYPYVDLQDMFLLAEEKNESPFMLILDTLQDPQNLGALLRTAEAVGVHGVILPLRHTATITPAVVHASSGASEHLLIGQSNLAQTISVMKEKNIWVIGLENIPEASQPQAIDLKGSIALVVGSEGEGMRHLVQKSCDLLMALPMKGKIESLNAAVAGSIALYLIFLSRSQ
ncbi:MAG: 23S rRNA (guanosine(2251)-2'-O)-methyltransferase RlmB [Anaerolineales bacterium]|nr:23S rRNA (guanosine(2251)-2'-O)-methyltransferase RlmB [Anaerolineales bacterium]